MKKGSSKRRKQKNNIIHKSTAFERCAVLYVILVLDSLIFLPAANHDPYLRWVTILSVVGMICLLIWGGHVEHTKGFFPAEMILCGFILLVVISLFYAYATSQAYFVIQRSIVAYAVFLVVMAAFRATEDKIHTAQRFLVALVILTTFLSILSIEAASTRILLSPLIDQMAAADAHTAEIYAHWNGVRMMTLINPNVSAPIFLIGILICHYLSDITVSDKARKRYFAVEVLLSMSFILCVSLGSIICGGASIIVYILIQQKGKRSKTLCHIFFVFVMGLVFACIAFIGMGEGAPLGFVAMVAVILCMIFSYFSSERIQRLIVGFQNKPKFFMLTLLVALTLILIGIWIFIPDLIFARINGIFSSGHASERLELFKNAIKIIGEHPIIGSGPGAFETKLMQVETSFIESKFVHNFYLQVMLENGVIGLLIVLSFVAYLLKILVKGICRRDEKSPLAILLIAAFSLIFTHSFIDFDMSFEFFIAFAFSLFAIAVSLFDVRKSFGKATIMKSVRLFAIIPIFVLILCLGTVISQHKFEKMMMRNNITFNQLLNITEVCVRLDFANVQMYKVEFLEGFNAKTTNGEMPSSGAINAAQMYVDELLPYTEMSINVSRTLITYYIEEKDFDKAKAIAKAMSSIRIKDPNLKEYAKDLYKQICEIEQGA